MGTGGKSMDKREHLEQSMGENMDYSLPME